jgi:hypothetical protein
MRIAPICLQQPEFSAKTKTLRRRKKKIIHRTIRGKQDIRWSATVQIGRATESLTEAAAQADSLQAVQRPARTVQQEVPRATLELSGLEVALPLADAAAVVVVVVVLVCG